MSIFHEEMCSNLVYSKLFAKEKCPVKHIYICSLDGSKGITMCSKLVGDYKKSLKEVAYHNKLMLLWVPVQCCIRDNIETDKLTQIGTNELPRFGREIWIDQPVLSSGVVGHPLAYKKTTKYCRNEVIVLSNI